MMVVGPGLGVIAKAARSSPRELRRRSVEHQKFMTGVMNIQSQGGRTCYPEFPEGATSMSTKEALAIRGSEENREVDVGEWRENERAWEEYMRLPTRKK